MCSKKFKIKIDCTILATGNDINLLCEDIYTYLATLHDWLKNRNLSLSTEKSTATLFTSWTKEMRMHLSIEIDGMLVPSTQIL